MKRSILIIAILPALLALTSPAPAGANVSVSVGFSFFYDELAPFGEWVTVGDYGEVWRPRQVAVGWQPYLNGRWRYTEFGWTWVSFDPWGGDPYHYGTWAFTADWGWVWVPGDIWAPAWVTWCDTGSYIGWAPVPPSVSITYAGYSGPAVVAPARTYVFVPTRSFVDTDVRTVRVDPERNATFVSGGRRMTSFAVSDHVVRTGGPPVSRIQKAMGAPVRTVNLSVAKTSPVPIARPVGTAKSLPVIMPRSERIAGKNPAVNRTETKAEPPVRHEQPPREMKAPHAAHPPAPHGESKAPPPPKKPEKHEGPEKNGR